MKVAALFAALLCLGSTVAEAQAPFPVNVEPLQRRISVHLRDVSLRDALDRVALLAGIRLSYSGDNLPLDRRVSVARDTTTVADVLDELLRTFPVQAVVVGNDHVVLAPRDPAARDSQAPGIAVLDRVVVTGSVIAASERPLPVALDVVRGRDSERRGESDLSKVLDGAVPGVWMWEQAPSSMMARYGSIRGASSFGLSYPKVYVDGIEVANPLLLTQITPEIVERVEVIRGPQGAALYGSDAISGVVNIVSRHEGTAPDGSHTMLRSEAGYTTAFNSTAVAVQEHTVTLRGGSNLRSGGVTVGASTTGAYVPEAYSRELKAVADTRVIGPLSAFTANARFFAKDAGVPPNPLLVSLNPDRFGADSSPQQLRMYAIGSTLTIAPGDRWTYTMTAGIDGYTLANTSNELGPIPSAADTALRDASGSATRGTMRASAVTSLGASERVGATITLAAEQSVLRDKTAGELTLGQVSGTEQESNDPWVVGWSSNTGVSAQGNLALFNAVYASAGLRHEHVGQTLGLPMSALLPMLGVAYVHDYGASTVKLRGAYGKGIRAPRGSSHFSSHASRMLENPNLVPEEQAGTEVGIDLILAGRVGLHATRFDQLASGLIQTTVFVIDSTGSGGPGKRPVYAYQLQNVGEISNRGWEGQATIALRSLSLAGAATFVDSRVRRLALGYTGDLRPGDRMLAVPARTFSGTMSWNGRSFQASSTLSRAFDWINYDRLAIAQALIANGDARNFSGNKLRQYWASYLGASRLRGSMSFDVWRGMALQATGENLLNYQRGEPDTITIVPGRTITLGVKARF